MKVKSESEVNQSCLTLSDPMDCSPPGSSVHGIFQARVLECGAIAFSISVTTNTLKVCGGILKTGSCNQVTLIIKISKNIHVIGHEAFTFEI